MTKYKVVLVPFPFDDLSSNKVRPAVCLTNPMMMAATILIRRELGTLSPTMQSQVNERLCAV